MLALFHRSKPHPVFEVLRVEDEGRTIVARPLFGPSEWNRTAWIRMAKVSLRNLGYYPKEVTDALIPELQA